MYKFLYPVLILIVSNANGQKLYVVPSLTAQYAYFAKAKIKEPDFSVKPKFNGSWVIDLLLTYPNSSFKLTLKESVIGENFTIKTDFGNDTSLGTHRVTHSDGIDQLIIGFQLQKFLFKKGKKNISTLNYFYGIGVGIGFNRSQKYYDSALTSRTTRFTSSHTKVEYTTSFFRQGMGFYIYPSVGVEWKNAKGKTFLITELYADIGLVKMFKVQLQYEYESLSNPALHKKVDNQVLFSKGSSVGLKVGIPIKLISFK